MDNNINTLDELHKGCCMGVDALNFILPKVEEDSFHDLLEKQKEEYEIFRSKVNDLYREYTTKDIHETSAMEKMRTWFGVEMDTMMDDSISNLADLLIKGTNMGIVEGKRLLNHKTMDKKVHKICSSYVKMQEEYLDKLKEYL